MYPYAGLPENLVAFGRLLTGRYGFRVGPPELQDAARALEWTRLGDERAVRHALRPVLCATREDVLVFDQAFQAFFHPSVEPSADDEATAPRRQWASDATRRTPRARRADARQSSRPEEEADLEAGDAPSVLEPTNEDGDEADVQMRAQYSPLAGQGDAPAIARAADDWRAAARQFVRRIETGRARRWQPAPRGPRVDLRRTLRRSLHTGGEVLRITRRARPRRRPRFVLLIDGSRSMSASAQTALQIAVSLATATSRIEVFVFSTELRRITTEVRRATGTEQVELPELRQAWGGGTSIGLCLEDFAARFGARLLATNTVVLIASDGLDTGEPDILRNVMARMQRVTAAIVWLNPLLDTPGYQPIARGMRTALPFITTFGWVADADGLRPLAGAVRFKGP